MDLPTDVGAVLMAVIRCPQTGERLITAGPDVLARLEQLRQTKRLTNVSGRSVEEVILLGLTSENGTWFYPVRAGMPILVAEEAIHVKAESES